MSSLTKTAHPLRQLRLDQDLTQEQLGALAEVSNVAVSRIESGRLVKTDTLRKVARALGVPIGSIVAELQPVLCETREDAAEFYGCNPEDLRCACEDGALELFAGWLRDAEPDARAEFLEQLREVSHGA